NSKSFLKEGTHELFLSEEAINLLQMWCNSPQQLRKMVGIILNAKNAVCKENEELGVCEGRHLLPSVVHYQQ
ncbi:hypothetical protein FDX20_25940, partial [Citrobacter sp. TBCS-11]